MSTSSLIVIVSIRRSPSLPDCAQSWVNRAKLRTADRREFLYGVAICQRTGWRLSPKVSSAHAPTHSNPFVSLSKRVSVGSPRGKTILVAGCAHAFSAECTGGWWGEEDRKNERKGRTHARESRSGASESTGVTFWLKGERGSLRMFEWEGLRDFPWTDFNLGENVCCCVWKTRKFGWGDSKDDKSRRMFMQILNFDQTIEEVSK